MARNVVSVFARVREVLESVPGIKLTLGNQGSWHIRQLHGKQVLQLMYKVSNEDLANAFPSPISEALLDLLEVLPFYVEAHSHVLYPQRSYGASCRKLEEELRATARMLHSGMSSLFPSTLKDPSDTSKGYYGAFTPPSNYAAIAHATDVFASHCYEAGSAAVTAAIFELGHIPMRKMYWATTTHGTQFDGRSNIYVELLSNLALQKISIWSNFGNQRIYPNVRRTRLRHHRRQDDYRRNRERAARARARWYECAWVEGKSCSYQSIAGDGRDNPNGFHRDVVNNPWLRVKQTGLEYDDAAVGAEKDDDLPIQTVEDCPVAAGPTGGDPDDDYDEMTDEEELRQMEHAPGGEGNLHACPVPDGPTVDDYERVLQEQADESEPTHTGDPEEEELREGTHIAPGGNVLVAGDVPLE